MATINITELKTIPEQVYQNKEDIEALNEDVSTAQTTANTAQTMAITAQSVANTALGTANSARDTANVANQSAEKAIQGVEQAWEKDFIDVVLDPANITLDNTFVLTNEIYTLDNIITITASPDYGQEIVDNAKNCAYYNLRPLRQETNGTIVLKVDQIPSVNLYLKIQVEIQIEVI